MKKKRIIGLLLCALGSYFLLSAKFSFKSYWDSATQKASQAVTTATKKTLSAGKKLGQATMKTQMPAYKYSPYKSTPAAVRVGNELSVQEKNYLMAREPQVKTSLERMLGMTLDGKRTPKIALIGSGGGYRAMTCTTGFLVGAQAMGLIDVTTYISALSGSTWAVNLWYMSGKHINSFKDALFAKMARGLQKVSLYEQGLILEYLFTKALFDQPVMLVDFYGTLLATALLDEFRGIRQRVTMSDQTKVFQDGQKPLPIYTAIKGEEGAQPHWYEVTPHEVGGAWLGHYVPTWAFGRKFENGFSKDFAPEQGLGIFMGTFGSAFAADFKTMFNEMIYKKASPVQKQVLTKSVEGSQDVVTAFGEKRITSGKFFNYTAGMPSSPLALQKHMRMVDAGIDFNLPYPPVSGERSERKADVLIFLDASGTVEGAPELRGAQEYARARGLKFPNINYDGIATRAVSVFKDETDPEVPVVIYLPRIKDTALIDKHRGNPELAPLIAKIENFDPETCTKKEFCSTFNFNYSPEQAEQLSALTEFNIRASKDVIVDALQWRVDN